MKKKIVLCAAGIVTVAVLAVAAFLLSNGRQKNTGTDGGILTYGAGAMGMGSGLSGNLITASGVTSIGMTSDDFEVEDLETSLYIEEVYVSTNSEIEAGTRILKISDDSVAEARTELEEKLSEADLQYRAGAISYEQSKITAKYDYETAVLAGEQAKEVYDETISSLSGQEEAALEALTEAREQIAEYQSALENDTYAEEYPYEELKALYDENLQLLYDKMEEWGVDYTQIIGNAGNGGTAGSAGAAVSSAAEGAGSAGVAVSSAAEGAGSTEAAVSSAAEGAEHTGVAVSSAAEGAGSTGAAVSSAAESTGNAGAAVPVSAGGSSGEATVLRSLYSVLEQNLQDYEEALSKYEDAVSDATLQVQILQLQISSLEAEYEQAKADAEEQRIQARLTYETSLAEAEQAQRDYETALQKAEAEYDELLSAREDAEENLALFEESIGDGYFCAGSSGTVVMCSYRAGSYLQSESMVVAYSNREDVSVAVSVAQENISSIQVGDAAYVIISGYDGFEGTVVSIDPVSSSGSRTSVTYTVTVALKGDVSSLPANESATVIFGDIGQITESMEQPESMPTTEDGTEQSGSGDAGGSTSDGNREERT